MALMMRRLDDWREPTGPTKLDAIAGSPMGCEYYDDDLPPAPTQARIQSWPLLVSLLCNAVLLGALVKVIVGR